MARKELPVGTAVALFMHCAEPFIAVRRGLASKAAALCSLSPLERMTG